MLSFSPALTWTRTLSQAHTFDPNTKNSDLPPSLRVPQIRDVTTKGSLDVGA